MKIKIGLSNRHVHLTNEDVEILFGKGYKLTQEIIYINQDNSLLKKQ